MQVDSSSGNNQLQIDSLKNNLEKVNKKIKHNKTHLDRAVKVAVVTFPLMPLSFMPMAVAYGLDKKASSLISQKDLLERQIDVLEYPVKNIPTEPTV